MGRLIDADNFLAYLIFSGIVDKATCGQLTKAVELCAVEAIPKSVLEDIKAEIEKRADIYFPSGASYDGDLYNGAYRDALYWCFDLIDNYKYTDKEQP